MHETRAIAQAIAQTPARLILFGAQESGCVAVAIKKYGVCRVSRGTGRIFGTDASGETFDLNAKLRMAMIGCDVEIETDVPSSAGLGSSAVVSILLSAAITADEHDYASGFFEKESEEDTPWEILSRAYAFESVLQSRSADVSASYFGGLVYLKGGFVKRLCCDGLGEYKILVYDSKIRKSACRAVHWPREHKAVHERIRRIAERACEIIGTFFYLWEIYDLIRENQDCLEELGLVPAEMKAEIARLRARNIEAKITGGGGGGFLFTLVNKSDQIDGWDAVEIDEGGFRFVEN